MYPNTSETNKDYGENGDEINYDNLANSMLEKMDKQIHDEASGFNSNSEYVNKGERKENSSVNNFYQDEKTNSPYNMRIGINEYSNAHRENTIDEHTLYGGSYPRKVMTALGPLPLPEEFKKNIPEKFVAKPIIEEREIYVSKKERKQREIEIPHVKYEHTFEKIKKLLKVNKLVPSVSEVIKEVPKEVLKPVIEEKIIEVPQGVKYIEVPVEVPCLYPPKIVPKVVTQYVERIVETIKPVVQEKIIEVPQTVIKQVPKIKTVEVPYYVPRYVEKVVEVPFKPNGEMPRLGTHIPFPISESFPPLKPTQHLNNNQPQYGFDENQHTMIPQLYCNTFNEQQNYRNNSEQNMQNQENTPLTVLKPINSKFANSNNTHQNSLLSTNSFMRSNMDYRQNNSNLYTQIENLPNIHNLPEGLKWNYPDGVVPAHARNNSNNMPPLVFTCPPEIGKVTCTKKDIQPDILTKTGVYEFDGFKKNGTSQSLFPPLAHNARVPFLPPPAVPGTPDVKAIQKNI
ncbi:inner membrane complex protein 1h, putative [Plasmodium vinckei lentum]|uniref:Inner membrane complex protein 1h, putative n=1 Tax=Plasmodium vinckei lentum TaxID=138297 RepID=A0A6V7SYN4_PLAVN|nr:inner membrane complex protein 1h, putative [Plasmodium vinckei lentum]